MGGDSPYVYSTARRLLAEGHRVTVLENSEYGWTTGLAYLDAVPWQDSLKRHYPDTYALVRALDCDLKRARTGRRDRVRAKRPFTHVIFASGLSEPGVRTAPTSLLDHRNRCLATALESVITQEPRSTIVHFTLLVNDDHVIKETNDNCNTSQRIRLDNVLTSELVMATFVYRSLYGIPVRILRLPSLDPEQLASPLVEEEVAIVTADASFSAPSCVYARITVRRDALSEVNHLLAEGRLQLLLSSAVDRPAYPDSRDALLTSYFTSKRDPQRAVSRPNTDNLQYVERWHDTAVRLGLYGVIFHDGLSRRFRDSTNSTLMDYELVTLGHRSTNDERYFHYLDYVERHPEIRYALLTDVSDVTFSRNPFQLMREVDARHAARLYVGEDDLRWPIVGESDWLMSILRRCYGRDVDVDPGDLKSMSRHSVFLNAGVIGGSRAILLRFLRQLTAVMRTASGGINCNMASVNYVAHKYFSDELFVGFPLTSQFKTYDKLYDGYIVHKWSNFLPIICYQSS